MFLKENQKGLCGNMLHQRAQDHNQLRGVYKTRGSVWLEESKDKRTKQRNRTKRALKTRNPEPL
ncbi:hypothetical protein CD201_13225 [Hafnia alvei]|nr:hypothetical protein CD201_13225 [Hafnia alvei]